MNKNEKLLKEFTAYCRKHPGLRFWQALRNFSGADAICFQISWEGGHGKSVEYTDTFQLNEKNFFVINEKELIKLGDLKKHGKL